MAMTIGPEGDDSSTSIDIGIIESFYKPMRDELTRLSDRTGPPLSNVLSGIDRYFSFLIDALSDNGSNASLVTECRNIISSIDSDAEGLLAKE